MEHPDTHEQAHRPRIIDSLIDLSIERAVPLRVIFEITYRCNAACDFCYVVPGREPELTTDECRALVDALKAEGCLFLTLTGGEPLVRGDFFEIAAHARAAGMALEVKTNATLIGRQAAARLRELSVMNVDVSLHASTAAAHDAVMQRPGAWQKALDGIQAMKAEGITVTVKCPLTRDNFEDRDAVRALAASLGCDCVFDLTLSAKQDGDLSPHAGRITQGQLEQFIAENEDDYFASVISCIGASERAELREQRPCSAGISTCSINPYGDVYPCVQLCCIIGNTRRSPFGEIWRDSPAVNKLRGVRFADLKDCNACPNVVHCLRCPGLALLEDGDILGRSTEACRQAEAYRRVHEQHESVGAVS